MPELPDITVYLERLAPRVLNQPLQRVRLLNPFVLRSVAPPIAEAAGKRVTTLRRLGKRIVFGLEDDLFLVLHLMIAGRLRWRPPGAKPPGRITLVTFDFPDGILLFTEAGSNQVGTQGTCSLSGGRPAGRKLGSRWPLGCGRWAGWSSTPLYARWDGSG